MYCYKGHGQAGTGNWCFKDGTLNIKDIERLVGGQYPLIIADCCIVFVRRAHHKDHVIIQDLQSWLKFNA